MVLYKLKLKNKGIYNPSASFENIKISDYPQSLQRDLIHLLEYDKRVQWYSLLPFEIDYEDQSGVKQKFSPDFLIEYREKKNLSIKKPPLICLLVSNSELRMDWNLLKLKCKDGIKYGLEKGFEFTIIRENDISKQYLKNVKFFNRYMRVNVNGYMIMEIWKLLERVKRSSINKIISTLGNSERNKREYLKTLRYMIAKHDIVCDLSKEISMESIILAKGTHMPITPGYETIKTKYR